MDAFGVARKRGRMADATANGTTKKSKEIDFQLGLGSKSKPCNKFFSTSGCPFGEGCHFLHYVAGGFNAAAAVASRMTNMGDPLAAARNHPMVTQLNDAAPSPPAVKTRICNKFNTAEGCKFGDKCHFAHGERELRRPMAPPQNGHSLAPRTVVGAGPMGGRFEPPPPPSGAGAAASFGASATAKISVDASLAGAIIGKGGVNTKQICRLTGAKLAIREHETDANLRNIELEGSFDQIKQASAMVRELIVNISAAAAPPPKNPASGVAPRADTGSNFKTKLCENFSKGPCTFGDRCHFAHGAAELRVLPGV